jgi:hypothetical protein
MNKLFQDAGQIHSSRLVMARMAEFAEEEVEEASKIRIVVFPYKAPSNLSQLYRVRGRMENKPGAMFVVAWILEDLSSFNILSSTGIDAQDGRGFVDAILAFDYPRSSKYLRGAFSHPDMIAKYIFHLKSALLGQPLAGKKNFRTQAEKLKDAKLLAQPNYLVAAIECAKNAIDPTRYSATNNCEAIVKAAKKWTLFWEVYSNTPFQNQVHPVNFMPSFGDSLFLAAAPYFIGAVEDAAGNGDNNEPLLRIENAFTEQEQEAFELVRHIRPIRATFERVDTIPKVPDHYINLIKGSTYCLKLTLTHATRLSKFLPPTFDCPTFATIGVDAASGTLSIHLKPKEELVRRFSLGFSNIDQVSSVSNFALQLFTNEFNLRALFDRHEASHNGNYNHTVEFTAAVEKSRLGLQFLGNTMAASMLRKTEKLFERMVGITDMPAIKVSQPYGVTDPKSCLETICACVSQAASLRGDRCRCDQCKKFRKNAIKKGEGVYESRQEDRAYMTMSDGHWHASVCVTGAGTASTIPFEKFERAWNPRAPFSALLAKGLGGLFQDLDRVKDYELPDLQARICDAIINGWDPDPIISTEKSIPTFKVGITLRVEPGDDKAKKLGLNELKFDKNVKSGQNGEVYFVTVTTGDGNQKQYALKIIGQSLKAMYMESPDDFPEGTCPNFYKVWLKPEEEDNELVLGILMDKLEGKDLEEYIKGSPHDISLAKIADYLAQTGELLNKWEDQGFVHWDIKPGNVFRQDSERMILIDVGLTGRINNPRRNIEKPFQLGLKDHSIAFGSKYHIPPEILENKETGKKTPVFGLASLACHLLGDPAALSSEVKVPPTVPSYVRYILGDDFDTLQKAVSEKPDDRPELKDLVECFHKMVQKLAG